MNYRCPYDDCSYYDITRFIEDGDEEPLAADDERRLCSGTVMVGSDADGWMPRPCLRPMDALLPDGETDHVDAQLPDLPPPPEPDPNPPAPEQPDPFVPASVAVLTAVAAAMATVGITSPNLTAAQKKTIEDKVTAQVQAVVDENLAG